MPDTATSPVAEMLQRGVQLADALNATEKDGKWVVKQSNSHWAYTVLDGESGRGICVNAQNKRKSIVSLEWPIDRVDGCDIFRPKDEVTSCTFNPARNPTDIAREIHRRLLGKYKELYAEQVELMSAQQANRCDRQVQVKRLLAILGEDVSPRQAFASSHRCYKHEVYEVGVNHDGTAAQIKTYNVPIEVATEILELLAARVPE